MAEPVTRREAQGFVSFVSEVSAYLILIDAIVFLVAVHTDLLPMGFGWLLFVITVVLMAAGIFVNVRYNVEEKS